MVSPPTEDTIQTRLCEYAEQLSYSQLPDAVVGAAKLRVVDTFGALLAAYPDSSCQRIRSTAVTPPDGGGATILGSRAKTSTEMAAFINGTTARFAELNDAYHRAGIAGGHPSDVIASIFAVAEQTRSNGRALIEAVVLAYEVYLRLVDRCDLTGGFDYTTLVAIGSALGIGKLMALPQDRLRHCVAIAVVSNNALRQSRVGQLSLWKSAASGYAGRTAVFAAQMASAGAEGPYLPFEGEAGWLDHVAGGRFEISGMGGEDTSYKIVESLIKPRPACGTTISSILAAEKAFAQLSDSSVIDRVTVETYFKAVRDNGRGDHHWNPQSRETADHSIPYLVAATLRNGTIGASSYQAEQLADPEIRRIIASLDVVEDVEFSAAYEKTPLEHRTRVRVITRDGRTLVEETGGPHGDVADFGDAPNIEDKFIRMAGGYLGSERAHAALGLFKHLETTPDVSALVWSLAP